MAGRSIITSLAAAAALAAASASAQVPVVPAAPQPDAGRLTPGLSVIYAYPNDIRYLGIAERELREDPRAGAPLVGLDYPDEGLGQPTLTSPRAEIVAAGIEGFVNFDQPGVWRLEVHSNDGIALEIGGQVVDRFDGRRTCDTNGWVEISVPEAGWYRVDAVYFQRLNTSCLMMRWEKPDGTREWTPTSAWAFIPE